MNKQDFIFSIPQLKDYLKEKRWDIARITLPSKKELNNQFFLLVPKYYIDLINWYDPEDPLRKMVITSNLETDRHPYELEDPIGDQSHSPLPGIVHRYPDRCLLMLTNICAVHCRFCFRRNLLHNNKADFEKSIQYIEDHQELWEVILSGGDPFMFTDYFLEKVLNRLTKIKHIKTIRFHTRTPAVYPQRVTCEFLNIISKARPLTVVFHINHPREITDEFKKSVELLKNAGAMLLSQTVLMKGVNNNSETLSHLFKGLVEISIKPYYLHHLDLAEGTHHFRVPIEEGKSIMHKLRGNISGVCLPEYVIDTPGGYGKVPVFWFQHVSKNTYQTTSFEWKNIVYIDHAQ